MHIKTLTLKNFRGASDLAVDFHSKLNVFYGENGAGKSTILDAISIMLSWQVNRIGHAGASGRPIQEEDITNETSLAKIELTCDVDNLTVNWKLVKSRKGHSSADERSALGNLNDYAKQLRAEITATNERTNLPVFAYYPVNRAVVEIPLRIKEKHSFSLLTTYDGALSSGANFRTFFEWFREREDLENENIKDQQSLSSKLKDLPPDPQLEAVRDALERLMPDFQNFTVRRDPLRMEVEKNRKKLTINQLSDGEKCLMAMVGDLARRMAIANPVSGNPLEGDGIVLIDEIDLHLHPVWQAMIIPQLDDVFPNCQFIVSTHSPHVITHVHSKSLYMLKQTEKGIDKERPSESYGKSVDRVLEDLMGLKTTRPELISDSLHALYMEIDNGQLDEARNRIEELKAEIGADPELAKAEVIIKRKGIIGK